MDETRLSKINEAGTSVNKFDTLYNESLTTKRKWKKDKSTIEYEFEKA